MEVTIPIQTLITVFGIVVTGLTAFFAVKYAVKNNKRDIDDLRKDVDEYRRDCTAETEKLHARIREKDARFTQCMDRLDKEQANASRMLSLICGKLGIPISGSK